MEDRAKPEAKTCIHCGQGEGAHPKDSCDRLPDGFRLADGWQVDVSSPWACSMSYCENRARYRSATHGACWVHAKEMRAVVPAEPSRPVTGEACRVCGGLCEGPCEKGRPVITPPAPGDRPGTRQFWECDQCGAKSEHGDDRMQDRIARGDYRCPRHAHPDDSCDGIMKWHPAPGNHLGTPPVATKCGDVDPEGLETCALLPGHPTHHVSGDGRSQWGDCLAPGKPAVCHSPRGCLSPGACEQSATCAWKVIKDHDGKPDEADCSCLERHGEGRRVPVDTGKPAFLNSPTIDVGKPDEAPLTLAERIRERCRWLKELDCRDMLRLADKVASLEAADVATCNAPLSEVMHARGELYRASQVAALEAKLALAQKENRGLAGTLARMDDSGEANKDLRAQVASGAPAPTGETK